MEQGSSAEKWGKQKPEVLIVDDPYRSFQSLPRLISREAFSVNWVPDEHQGLELLRRNPEKDWIVIVDLKSSGMGGAGFLHQARQIVSGAAILVTSPLGPFLYKDGSFFEFSGPSLRQEINKILYGIAQRPGTPSALATKSQARPELRDGFGTMVGRSEKINEIYRLILNLRNSSATVMIQGESGTGKELIARMIHQNSRRREKPFVAVNCGAIPAALVESELFGHERGAFTGAVCQKKGRFEVAHGGTLFLDEIGELGKDLQVKLLRVLQEREFQRVGGNRTLKADVRIIAATSQDLKSCMQAGDFREDLYYRLNVVPIEAPPLRDRREDIPLLLDHFFKKISRSMGCPEPSISPEARRAMIRYSYPGNVRELANIVERLLVTCPDGKIRLGDLPREMQEDDRREGQSPEMLRELPDAGVPLREVERELILKTLERASGNKRAAAEMLGITRRLLYLRLMEYGLVQGKNRHRA
ncbi:MAG: sigma-54-dependent Fis family transcriptional regulator [Deltaproteobacteria bacterium]|nr:sigma-54-dependent Fis family transcriptional regulator [Deltaproteobacteria bacterium]